MELEPLKIITDLTIATFQDKIIWGREKFGYNEFVYKYSKQLTKKKKLEVILHVTQIVENSFVVIYLRMGLCSGFVDRKYVDTIRYSRHPSLRGLINVVERKVRVGKVKENMSYGGTERTEKLKNFKFIGQLLDDSMKDVLKWDVVYHDDEVTTLSSSYSITKNKDLTFSLRFEEGAYGVDKNTLRVFIRIKSDLSPPSSHSNIIKSLPMKEYPTLKALIRYLKIKYLEKIEEYELPHILVKPGKSKDSKVVIARDFQDYKAKVIAEITEVINKLPKTDDYIDKFGALTLLKDDMYQTTEYDELNSLMFKAHLISTVKRNKATQFNRKP